MKKTILFILLPFCFFSLSFFPGDTEIKGTLNNVVVQFMTTNYMSNNLYIDNFSIGRKFDYDIAALSINNISSDTSYSINGNNTFKIAPKVSFLNVGKFDITSSFNVNLQVSPGNYISTKQINVLNNHRAIEIIFDSLTIIPGTQYSIKSWSSLGGDQNRSNDTIAKFSLYLPGTRRNVLFEAYTNVSCLPCGTNNPYLDTFITARFDSIVAIKYHTYWPFQGDPMYTQNPQQIRYKIKYYPVNNVPVLNVDGIYLNIYPYTNLSYMLNPYRSRIYNGSPLGISVTDARIGTDTICASITLIIYSPLHPGNFRMRLNAIERYIHYQNPPGSNGEKDFYDVFRQMYPDTNGILIPSSTGEYNYIIKYGKNPLWVDSMIYSAVYVQNETTKEVINSAKARHQVNLPVNTGIVQLNTPYPNGANKIYSKNNTKINIITDTLTSGFYLDAFENEFPPSGWTLTNTDNVNFSQSNLASGPSFGGSKSLVILLQSASGLNSSYHYLKSRVFNNVNFADSIKFDWAFAPYGNESIEGLKVQVSLDGGISFPYTIFNRVGSQLATAPYTGESFVPVDSSQWQTFSICLNSVIGIRQISENVPDKFNLYQNYPNPFNPTTKIKFQVASIARVKIVVFDILGREITKLVDKQLKPGSYEVEWIGTNSPSGIYFYRYTITDPNRANVVYDKIMKMVMIR